MTDPNDVVWGRHEDFDQRSLAYSIAEHPAVLAAERPARTWRWDAPAPAPLDQRQTEECVAFSWAHAAIAAPAFSQGYSATTAHSWYRQCKAIDGLGRGVGGTTVLAGAKVAKRTGIITSYRWAMSEPDLAAGVSWVGPAVIGVVWRKAMLTPDERSGFLTVAGAELGGHATLVIGFNAEGGYYTILNSWGRKWGFVGTAKIRRADMAKLIGSRRGEACIPTQTIPEGDDTATTGGSAG